MLVWTRDAEFLGIEVMSAGMDSNELEVIGKRLFQSQK